MNPLRTYHTGNSDGDVNFIEKLVFLNFVQNQSKNDFFLSEKNLIQRQQKECCLLKMHNPEIIINKI